MTALFPLKIVTIGQIKKPSDLFICTRLPGGKTTLSANVCIANQKCGYIARNRPGYERWTPMYPDRPCNDNKCSDGLKVKARLPNHAPEVRGVSWAGAHIARRKAQKIPELRPCPICNLRSRKGDAKTCGDSDCVASIRGITKCKDCGARATSSFCNRCSRLMLRRGTNMAVWYELINQPCKACGEPIGHVIRKTDVCQRRPCVTSRHNKTSADYRCRQIAQAQIRNIGTVVSASPSITDGRGGK